MVCFSFPFNDFIFISSYGTLHSSPLRSVKNFNLNFLLMIYGTLVLSVFEGNVINNNKIGVLITRSKALLFLCGSVYI